MAKRKVLVDVSISCDPPEIYRRWDRSLEYVAKEYEAWVKEFHDFIRDHRSQDPVTLTVEREYEDQCSFCGSKWETDEHGAPLCCNEATEEWDATQQTRKVQSA